jgi:signal transduction histidine kinase/DNA-binding response OmpR family regulator
MNYFRILLFIALAYLTSGFSHAIELSEEEALLHSIEALNLADPSEAKKLLDIAKSNKAIMQSASLQSHLYNLLAQKAMLKAEYDTAAANLQLARQLARQSGNQLQEAESLRREGILLLLLEQYSEALASLNQAVALYSKIDSPKIITSLESVLNVYLHLGMQEKIKHFGHMLLEEATKRAIVKPVYSAHYFLAEAYLMENDIEKARYHTKQLFDPISENQLIIQVLSYAILAKLELAVGNNSDALRCIRIAKENAEKNQFTVVQAEIVYLEADILFKSNNLSEAKEKFEELLHISNIVVRNDQKLSALQKLSELSESESDYKSALNYARTYSSLKDQSNLDKERQLLAIHQARLGITIKENQIKELTLEGELSSQKQKNQMVVIIISAIALTSLVIFSIAVYRQKRKLKSTYQALERASDAKSQFLARMSHEIRTPINAIIGLTKLSLNTRLNEKQAINLKQIEESSQTLLAVINDVLDYSKIEAGELNLSNIPFDIEEVINRSVRLNSIKVIEKNIELVKYISRDIPLKLVGDPQRLQQVLNNLLSNAIKFTHSGTVAVSVKRIYVDGSLVLEFEVKDTGIGIDIPQQRLLFDSFSQADESITREYGGTGLGLAICKQLVELMGGKIWVESMPGKGASFFFTIKTTESTNSTAIRFTPQSLQNLKVLIIDDVAISRQLIGKILSSIDIDSDQAINGSEGIGKFRQSVIDNFPYDLIVLDWKMPHIDGIEVASVIRQECLEKQPIIIMMASRDITSLKSQSKALGINLYLNKPVDSDTLIAAIMGESDKVAQQTIRASDGMEIPNFSRLHILLVEDNSINQKVALAYLKDTHAKVSVVENGKLAIEKLAEDTSVDMVLMDIQMPVMDGFTATQIIRNELKLTLPIIAMTAYAMTNEVSKSFEIGMNAHISKPIDSNLLYQAIQKTSKELTLIPPVPSNNETIKQVLSNSDDSLVIIDRAKAIKALLNDETAYQELVSDFISMYSITSIPTVVNSPEELSSIQQTLHSIHPALSYIGVYNLAEFTSDLENEFKLVKLPLDTSQEDKIDLLKSALEKVANRLRKGA